MTRLILSRKGFDSTSGGYDSPVLPNGRIVSLPIPGATGPTYGNLRLDSQTSYADLMLRLGIEEVDGAPTASASAHADPDLEDDRAARSEGWLPMFGQADQAQSHLRNRGVGAGDVFVFFGRFSLTRTGDSDNRLRYVGQSFHLIWGYLEVDRVIKVAETKTFEQWMSEHVHIKSRDWIGWKSNTVYVARRQSSFRDSLPGGGIFRTYEPSLRLTQPGGPLSTWLLPLAFHPSETTYPLTWNAETRWTTRDGKAVLRAASRGQEFVVEMNSGIRNWLRDLLALA